MLAALGAVIAASLLVVPPLMADESYVCDDGRVVTVRFGELEKLARTDPCIARYLSRRSGPLAAQPAAAEAAIEVDIPLPGRRPAVTTASAGADVAPRHAETEVIVHYEAPPAGEAAVLKARVEQIAFRRASHHFYSNEQLSARPVDFRNVPIINAAPGEPDTFHHTR